ncbi:MAG: lysine-sensitive aspartokinase 3, partial [Gammaproteobacteria bacterium]|nr:lysine-sensitive aspartokinase 3 [Gammaproteobacteria bacterium]
AGVCKDVFAWLEEHTVRMICHGASNDNLSILLPADNADSAIKALHYRLFE